MLDGSDQAQVTRRRPRILMVTARYLPLVGGGAAQCGSVLAPPRAPRLGGYGPAPRTHLAGAAAAFEIDYYSRRLRVPRERFVLIPNGSDLPKTATLPDTHRDDALIASVGRLERYKGHHRVIAALPYLLRSRPEIRLWVAGSG